MKCTVAESGIGFLLQQWVRLLVYEQVGAAVPAIALFVAITGYASTRVTGKVIYYLTQSMKPLSPRRGACLLPSRRYNSNVRRWSM